jgi:hypothetical protein
MRAICGTQVLGALEVSGVLDRLPRRDHHDDVWAVRAREVSLGVAAGLRHA